MTRRLEALEENQSGAEPESTRVQSFLNDNLTLGGFFETAITGVNGPDTPRQVSAASNTLGLNLSATFDDEFRFASQILTALSFPIQNVENDPRLQPSQRKFAGYSFAAIPTQAYVQWSKTDAFRIQGGLGYVPFGFALQQRELVLFVRRGGPQLIRTQELVSPLWTGIHLSGSLRGLGGQTGYSAYTFNPLEDTAAIGGGARVWWSSLSDAVTLGASAQVGKRDGDTFKTLGLDARVRLAPFAVTTEYARKFLSERDDPWTVYVEPNISVSESVLLFVFTDYANSPLATTSPAPGAFAVPYRRIEYGGGVNWLPTSFTRFRLAAYILDYVGDTAKILAQDRDFYALDLSAGIAF